MSHMQENGSSLPFSHVDLGGHTTLSDVRALVLRLHEIEQELKELREKEQTAADDAWAAVALRVREIATAARKAETEDAATRNSSSAIDDGLAKLWDEQQIELENADGRHVDELPPGEFEVLSTQAAASSADVGRVLETWRPLVRRRGRVVICGQVIVGEQP